MKFTTFSFMLRPLNFNTRSKKLWITADTHFNHDKPFIVAARGHKTVQDHDAHLIYKWNSVVGPNDNVLHLGDVIINDGNGAKFQNILPALNGHIYLLWGNHNSGVKVLYRESVKAKYGRDDIEVYPHTYADKVTFCGNQVKGFINGIPYVASHFAPRIWEEMQHGAISLSGHSHGSDNESNADWLGCRRLDCGVDNFQRPISFEEVMMIMESKKVPVIDHHDSNTVSAIG